MDVRRLDDTRLSFSLVTRTCTRKATQLAADSRVTLAFHDPRAAGENGYVALSGRVREVVEKDARRAVWKDSWTLFHTAPEVLPPSDHPSYADAIPGPPISDATDVAARLEAIDDWLGRHDDAAAAFLERVNVRGPGMAKAPSVFGLGAGVVGVPEGDVAVVDDVACGALGCGLAD